MNKDYTYTSKEIFIVILANTIIKPFAVMIKMLYTSKYRLFEYLLHYLQCLLSLEQ